MMEFFAPDAQPTDAYGWLVNQTSHWALGVLLVWLIGHIFGEKNATKTTCQVPRGNARGHIRIAFVVSAAGFLAWEAAQIYAGGALSDSAADAAFVALGAAWGARGGSWLGLALLAGGLFLGVSARL